MGPPFLLPSTYHLPARPRPPPSRLPGATPLPPLLRLHPPSFCSNLGCPLDGFSKPPLWLGTVSFTECTLPACCIPCKDSFWKLAQCLWQIYFHMHTFRAISPLSKRRENDARDRHAQMVHPVPLALIRPPCRMSLWHKRLLSGRYEHFTCHACWKYIRHRTLFAKVRSCLCRAYCRRRQCASYKRHRQ